MDNKQEWLRQRLTGITGTDAGVIMGCSPYKTIQQLYKEKIGELIPEDISDKEVVKYGLAAEEHIRELFKLDYPQYEVTHKEYDIIKHKEHDWLLATVDGQIRIKNPTTEADCNRSGILEIKTALIQNSLQHSKWKDKIPENYYCQILHYLNVCSADFAIVRAYLKLEYYEKPRIETVDFHIERNEIEEDIELLEAEEARFWQCKINRQLPNWNRLPSI